MSERYETMLFNYETTNRTDYQECEMKPPVKPIIKEKTSCLLIRPPPLKDIHTLSEWKRPNVPFHLYFRPKEIIRTNPYRAQRYYEKSSDLGWELAKKTRPRLVMTPAVSMDDITPPEKRELLVRDVYASTAHNAMRDGLAVASVSSIRAPLSDTPAPANPITLQKLHMPYVSPEWRVESASWDRRQLRTYCEPNREFYLARKPQCDVCDVTATLQRHKKIGRK